VARKETIKHFVRNLHKADDLIVQAVKNDWNANTIQAMEKAQLVAPVKKTTLQRSAREVKAKITKKGIQSAFIFGVPYALKLEQNKDGLTIHKDFNRLAQDHFAKKGADDQTKYFMSDIKKAISVAWGKV